MHVYVVENFKRILILMNLVIKGAIANNLTTMVKIFITKFDMAMKVVCLGPNGAPTFHPIEKIQFFLHSNPLCSSHD
jgi:hypothetical protein